MVRIATGKAIRERAGGYTNVPLPERPQGIGLHRIKFCLKYGWLPHRVDHKNGSRAANRVSNLRAATHAQNMMNQPNVHSRRTLPRGVYLRPSGKFQAKAWDGKRYNVLGMFDGPMEASRRVEAFLHIHHGEFYVPPKGEEYVRNG